MFTSKSISLLFLVIILLAIAWNTDITMVYIFFVVSFIMFILLFINMQFNIPDISLGRSLHHMASEDEMVNIKMSIKSKKPYPISFFEILDIFPGGPQDEQKKSIFILNIAAKESKSFDYQINCYRRGLWRIGPISVISQDSLGFFKMKKVLNVFSEILVYPNIFRIFAFPVLNSGSVSWMGVETAKISGDSHEFFGVREYKRGDMMSRIHWSLTAKHNKLIVKQFERSAVQEVTIVLDLKKGYDIGTGKDTTLEYGVKIAGSITRYLLNIGALVQIIGCAKEVAILPFGKGESQLYKIMEYLAKVKSESQLGLSQVLDEASFAIPYNSTLITIMLDNDIDTLSSFIQFKVKGIKLIVIVLSVSTFGHIDEAQHLSPDEARRFDETLANLEAYVYRIAKGDDLAKKFETL